MARWCHQQNVVAGEILSLQQIWALSKLWYKDRLDPNFAGRTVAEALQIFQQLGLTSAFWQDETDSSQG